jgi:hypothetical protein
MRITTDRKQEAKEINITKKILLLACIIVAFQFPTMGWADVYVLNTGPADTGVSTPRSKRYVLWNAPGAFARVGYAAHRLRPVVKERAQGFTNLTASEERPMSTSEP